MGTVRRMFSILLALAFVFGVVAMPRTVSAKELCFAGKTEYCLNDPFSGYWDNNGGLPVFGYPITAAAPEQNRDTGQTYNTQWVERNRMEVHPENAGTPYEILLGLLGKDRLAQTGRNWQAEPRETGAKPGCLWFEQTGHNVCNNSGNLGFKTYWETHGLKISGLDNYARSLQLFGLPLTEPKMETNSSGDTVLTQWFERARFEWHPNNPDEYKVLLGLLGKEVRGNAGPPPPPPPPATVAVVSHRTYVDSIDTRWIVGEVINNKGKNQQFTKIIANVYDANNVLIGTEDGYAYVEIIKPGKKSPFKVLFLDDMPNFHHYTFQIESRDTDKQPLDALTILSLSTRPSGIDGFQYVFGELRNDTGVAVQYTELAITCYTADGNIHQADFTYTKLTKLGIGETSTFETIMSEWIDGLRCEAQAQAMKQ